MLLISNGNSMKREILSLHCAEGRVWCSYMIYHWLTHFGIKSIGNVYARNVYISISAPPNSVIDISTRIKHIWSLNANLLKRFPHHDWLKYRPPATARKPTSYLFTAIPEAFCHTALRDLGCLTRWLRVEGITSRLLCKAGCSSSQLLGESSPRSVSLHHCCLPISKYLAVQLTWYLSKINYMTTFCNFCNCNIWKFATKQRKCCVRKI